MLQQGLVQRTPRGRMLTDGGFRYMGLTPPATPARQMDLLSGGAGDEPDEGGGE